MKKISVFLLLVPALTSLQQTALAGDDPQPVHAGTRVLHSGSLVVEIGDPDSPDLRWNKGLRFSPVANVVRVQLDGRDFVYAPVAGGSLSFVGGLPMEFDIGQEAFQPDPPGYNEGGNGAPFLKIGVGILTRNSAEYNFSSSYPVVELAQTTTTWQRDRACFVQTLSGTANGYSYRLGEDVVVKNDRLIMHYVLTNTGTKTFTTEQYLHNFLTFGQRNVGPNYRVYFPYDMTASPAPQQWEPPQYLLAGRGYRWVDNNPPMVSLENMILYTQTISSVPKTWIYKPDDYIGADTIAVEQSDIGQRVVIDSSLRSAYIGVWTTSYQVSPEQFIIITLAPGEHAEFTRAYRFAADDSTPKDCTGDKAVDAKDLSALSSAWLTVPGDPNWNPSCDISIPGDDIVNNEDLAVLGQAWGQVANGPDPAACWLLDENAGLVAGDTAGSHDGSLMGFAADDSQWVTGHLGGGLEFDGRDDFVEVPDFGGICGKKARAVFAWIKTPPEPTGKLPVVSWGKNEPGAYWLVEVDEDQRLRLSCGSGFVSANEQQIGDGAWHHVAIVLDPVDPDRPLASDTALYVDGQRRTIYRMHEATIDTACAESVRIGAALDPDTGTFAGIIDDVMIFDAAVDATGVRRAHIR